MSGVENAIKSANYDYGRQLVRRCYVVAVPCLTPFGRRGDKAAFGKQDPCAVTFVRLQLLGKVLMAENLRDCLWALEMLARRDEVDAKRLGCVGLSYGGRMTMLTAALEPYGLSLPAYTALSVLRANDGLSNAQLARRSLVTPQSMSEALGLLVELGYVKRRNDPGHGRIIRTEITRSGLRALERCDHAVDAVESELLDGIDPDEVAVARSVLSATTRT